MKWWKHKRCKENRFCWFLYLPSKGTIAKVVLHYPGMTSYPKDKVQFVYVYNIGLFRLAALGLPWLLCSSRITSSNCMIFNLRKWHHKLLNFIIFADDYNIFIHIGPSKLNINKALIYLSQWIEQKVEIFTITDYHF